MVMRVMMLIPNLSVRLTAKTDALVFNLRHLFYLPVYI